MIGYGLNDFGNLGIAVSNFDRLGSSFDELYFDSKSDEVLAQVKELLGMVEKRLKIHLENVEN